MITGTRVREITLPELKGGLNVNDPENSINDNQSTDLLNVWYKGKAMTKRYGQTLVTALSNVYRISKPYNSYQAVHAGTKLYKWDGTTATEIKSGIQNSAGTFVEFGDDLYYLDGAEIWAISSGYVVSAVVPYNPVVLINAAPTDSKGDDNEAYNLISNGFTVWYNGDGSHSYYYLPQQNLMTTTVEIVVGDTTLTEGTDFSVAREKGLVNFSGGSSPHGAPEKGTNNVRITAYKNFGTKANITACKIAIPYGGESSGVEGGSRVFVMGNPSKPYTYWRSDLGLNQSYGMTYFPDTAEERLDSNSERITAAAKMQGELIIFKTDSIFAVGYEFDGREVYYPVRECNSSIGCDMPGSVQLIDNKVVFANSKSGAWVLSSTSNKLENTVKPLSANINNILLKEPNLTSAVSCDFEQYYWLSVNGNTYLWDYGTTPYYNQNDYDAAQRRLAWYKFSNINAADFYVGNDLYYARSNGIVKFVEGKNDFGAAIPAKVKTKAFDMGAPDLLKTFSVVYPSFAKEGNTTATISVNNEKGVQASKTFEVRNFRWSTFHWSTFTWNTVKYSKTFAWKIKMKKSAYLQLTIESNGQYRGLGIAGFKIEYTENRKIKG